MHEGFLGCRSVIMQVALLRTKAAPYKAMLNGGSTRSGFLRPKFRRDVAGKMRGSYRKVFAQLSDHQKTLCPK